MAPGSGSLGTAPLEPFRRQGVGLPLLLCAMLLCTTYSMLMVQGPGFGLQGWGINNIKGRQASVRDAPLHHLPLGVRV